MDVYCSSLLMVLLELIVQSQKIVYKQSCSEMAKEFCMSISSSTFPWKSCAKCCLFFTLYVKVDCIICSKLSFFTVFIRNLLCFWESHFLYSAL
jgi:hypothetical protein